MHLKNDHREINIFEDIEILKVGSSGNLLHDVINVRNDPVPFVN